MRGKSAWFDKRKVQYEIIHAMKAIQVNKRGGDFELVNKAIPNPNENEILIKVQVCGVCHGDAVTKEGYFPDMVYPKVPGHEVIGIVSKLGGNTQRWQVGQRVGVGWHGGHCNKCAACLKGNFLGCENSLTTGISTHGGYAEYMVARSEAVVSIPDELNSAEAAPLLCAGRTTFGALLNSGARGGDLVAIHGLGGLGHLAVQYAVKLGFKTIVISHSTEKEALAYQLGAHAFINSTTADPAKELKRFGGAKAIISLAPDAKMISHLVSGLCLDGQIIVVTAVNEPIQLNSNLLFSGASIKGFAGGNIEDTMQFSMLTKVVPTVEVFPLEQAATAYEKMMSSKVHFRAVLKISD